MLKHSTIFRLKFVNITRDLHLLFRYLKISSSKHNVNYSNPSTRWIRVLKLWKHMWKSLHSSRNDISILPWYRLYLRIRTHSKITNWNLKSARTWNLVFRLPRFIDLYIQIINLHDWEEKEGKNKKEKQESSLNETMNF